ncbi:MAG: MBL fold metallo-hydrolase [Neisseriaceae bacterium]|nr:MBL fold metallo-hydrolase [Neisseriaceae bacterium]MBP6863027.1 MBL fold metallo-hydrolase [Neisseriaceae bacterium]
MLTYLKSTLTGSLLLSLLCLSSITHATPNPKPKAQVPGYQRLMIGDIEVTALYDGHAPAATNVFTGIDQAVAEQILSDDFVPNPSSIDMTITAYLVKTRTNLVLVDAGASQCHGDNAGSLIQNLRAAGYQPRQIDTILITHLHGDHVCGISQQGRRLFPNATVYLAEAEADFWLSQDANDEDLVAAQPSIKMAQEALAPYIRRQRLQTFGPTQTHISGIQIVPTAGHTPGHTVYAVNSNNERLFLWGDLLHNNAIQFPNPEVTLRFDIDPAQARATRLALLNTLAAEKIWIGGPHLPFPGLGRIRAEGSGYVWVPVNYEPLPNPTIH